MGLIFALFDVALSQDRPFCEQQQQLQSLHHGYTKLTFILLCSPFLLHCPVGDDLRYTHYNFSARLG